MPIARYDSQPYDPDDPAEIEADERIEAKLAVIEALIAEHQLADALALEDLMSDLPSQEEPLEDSSAYPSSVANKDQTPMVVPKSSTVDRTSSTPSEIVDQIAF